MLHVPSLPPSITLHFGSVQSSTSWSGPQMMWSLHSWRYSKAIWEWSRATPGVPAWAGEGEKKRSLQSSRSLWFCKDTVGQISPRPRCLQHLHPHVRKLPGLLREEQREIGTLRSWVGITNVRFPSFESKWKHLGMIRPFTVRSGFDQIPQTIKISMDPFNVSNLKDLCWDFT